MDLKHTNSAVIKKMLMNMDKETFIENAGFIKKKYIELVPIFHNQNYERKLRLLVGFSILWYRNFWAVKLQKRAKKVVE